MILSGSAVAPPAADPLTDRMRATWMAGDFGRIAPGFARGAADLVSRLGLVPGEALLDVACGTGNTAIPAARTGAIVTGIDIAPNLVVQAREAAAAAGVAARFEEGNCERLPYAEATFDTVLSMFGAMFAPQPDRAASELVRVCRPGGRVVMVNWTTAGFMGQLFRATAAYVPPPPGVASPLLWGHERAVRERFDGRARRLECTRRLMTFEFPFPPATVVEYFRAYDGPTLRAFDVVDPTRRARLCRDLEDLWMTYNRATDGTTRVESEYLEVTVVVR